ncbi:uncharacterized protein LOC135938395 [Cloeon dipterum]|uniref:uncharacterized protein LOC135938395 n=1 Tax=Cloeon dipterum TaxID=197152 RepID=UPI00322002F7
MKRCNILHFLQIFALVVVICCNMWLIANQTICPKDFNLSEQNTLDLGSIKAHEQSSTSTAKVVKSIKKSDVVGLPPNDERLVEFTRNLLIKPDFTKPYVLDAPEKVDQSWFNTSTLILSLANKKARLGCHKIHTMITTTGVFIQNGGFFVECGAHEGEAMSNTILLERAFGWTGLLVEGAPLLSWFVQKLSMARNYTFLVVKTTFYDNNYGGRVSPKRGFVSEGVHVDALCIPFNTLMRAMDRTEVDLFSLDVESFELDILKTINFLDVKINILCVEFFLLSPIRAKELLVLMKEQKFRLISRTDQDLIYVHETYVLPAGIKPMVITEEEIMKSLKGVPY